MTSIWRTSTRSIGAGALRRRRRRWCAAGAAALVVLAIVLASGRADRRLAVAVFLGAVAIVATLTAVRVLRRRSVQRAHVARARRDLAQRLAVGEEPWRVVVAASDQIEEIFGFDECRADLDAQGRVVVFTSPSAIELSPRERVVFRDFVAALVASVERLQAERPKAPAER